MHTFSDLQKIIQDEIIKISIDKEPRKLYEPISYTLSRGGKRVRPILCLAACNLFSDDIKPAVPAASALEIFHNFTLLHDDVMDNSPTRRGEATVHKKWDVNTAILSGDAMIIKANQLMLKSPKQYLKEILTVYNQTALEVCEGQQYDMDFENRDDVTIPEYLNMIRLKTSVLLAGALKIGAITGGADTKQAQKIYDFGIALGTAFQLQDDFLDTFGNAETFGKRIGGDILEEKKTYLLLRAYQKATENQKKTLNQIFGNPKISEQEKIEQVTAVFNQLNIKNDVLAKIQSIHQTALENLKQIAVPEERKKLLYDFSDLLLSRNK